MPALCLCADAAAARDKRCRQLEHRSRQHIFFRVVNQNHNPATPENHLLFTYTPRRQNSAATASAAEGSGHSPRHLAWTSHPVNSDRSVQTGQFSGSRLRRTFRWFPF